MTVFFLVSSVIKIVAVFTAIMTGVALLTLAERRICAWMQDRLGPNRVGPQGLLQPAADGLKNFIKEETLPAQADKALFLLAPAIAFIPALLTFAVIPFAAPLPTPWGDVDMVVANLPVGFLYILALGSLGVYGIVLAGWSSNNKYSLLGGLRAGAQMIRGRLRRDQPPAVRSPRGRGRADRGLSHRVQRDEILDVLHRRVRQHGHGLGAYDDAVLRGLGHSVHDVGQHAAVDDPQDARDARGVFGEGAGVPVRLHLGALDAAPVPLRSWVLHDRLGWSYDQRFALALFGLNLLLAVPLFFVLDRGRIVAGSVAEERV